MAETTTPTTPTKPTLVSVRDRIQSVDRYFLDTAARTQAVGSASTVIPLATLQGVARDLTQAMIDLEANL